MEIRLRGITKTYVSQGQTVRALDDVSLTIPANQIFTLLGPSGCGKTTLLRCIVGLETPDDGEIAIGGEIVWSKAARIALPPQKRRLGMVFQTYAIWPHMSMFDNIAYPLKIRKDPPAAIRDKVRQALEFVQLSHIAEGHPVTKLSGGQQQRVALARALVAEPRVILFDEPLSNLDAKLREDTRKLLKTFLGKLDITAVYVTHDRVEALALSDQLAVMRGGRLVETGTPQQIYFNPNDHFVADFIGRANLVRARVRAHQEGLTLVDSPMGIVQCAGSDHPVGGDVMLCIRPESIHVNGAANAATSGAANGAAQRPVGTLEGRVESLSFVGEVYEAEIRVAEQLLLARIDPTARLDEGAAVRLSIDPSDCSLVPA